MPPPFDRAHGTEYVEWAPRPRSGEREASKGNNALIVPLPACRQAGNVELRGTCRSYFYSAPHLYCLLIQVA
jgi:hypothetical protein